MQKYSWLLPGWRALASWRVRQGSAHTAAWPLFAGCSYASQLPIICSHPLTTCQLTNAEQDETRYFHSDLRCSCAEVGVCCVASHGLHPGLDALSTISPVSLHTPHTTILLHLPLVHRETETCHGFSTIILTPFLGCGM